MPARGAAFYAVARGRRVGTFRTWPEAEAQVKGFPNARYKKFDGRAEAEAFITQHRAPANAAPPAAAPRTRKRPAAVIDVDAEDAVARAAPPPPTERPSKRRRLEVVDAVRAARDEAAAMAARASVYPMHAPCTLYFDGASKGNPGLAGGGCWLATATGEPLWELYDRLPKKATNNEAEYHGLLLGLRRLCQERRPHVLIRGDSKLVLLQVQGVWKAHLPHIQKLRDEACRYIDELTAIPGARLSYEHVLRARNAKADALANRACGM
eukprot:TRINITY_DN10107_c0_g1_i1.p1 TRINITY_DN10107_c0_g1~~TRINITY_DN10107_c0_g1_i1.p1  ORF type:complete len:267 (+),score=86.90 TRINITY_DN10107_c0_g1_i1:55-855(+)